MTQSENLDYCVRLDKWSVEWWILQTEDKHRCWLVHLFLVEYKEKCAFSLKKECGLHLLVIVMTCDCIVQTLYIML